MLRAARNGLVEFGLCLGEHPNHLAAHISKIEVRNVDFWYGNGEKQALKDVNLSIYRQEVTAFIGPSGCGKTTLLRALNRSYESIPGARLDGMITLDGMDIHDPAIDPPLLRKRFGWVAQRPNPFPWSVYSNIAYAPRLHGIVNTAAETDVLVEQCLTRVGMWDEVKDRLGDPGTDLSGGQQQRLCIARAIAFQPEVILMDEPCSALDPGATAVLENLVDELRTSFTIIIVTHNMQQAARLAQRVAMFHLGLLVESGDADKVFVNPQHKVTTAFLEGRFG